MPTIHLTRGLPGSGKSTYAKQWVQEDPEHRVRVNRDDIRAMLYATTDKKLSPEQESHVSAVEKSIARAALQDGLHVIIDATNLNPRFIRAWLNMGYEVRFIDFPVALDEAIARNAARENPIPEQAIRTMHKRFTIDGDLPPAPVARRASIRHYTQDWNLPSVVMVDIDGTLAHNASGRSFYDMTRVGEDTLDANIAAIVNAIEETHRVILMSGRDETARADTVEWLAKNGVRYDHLFMRAAGDTRRDDVVKASLFDLHVRPRFNVLGVIDDRPQVCRMWRAMGLTTLQVGDPSFEF
ncbi:AAA family ATPase [Microbacterium binotii]|uniref:Polynucleotide kinase PNKP phosphatase domain-containing protein n=1 Tax=Microbacterium binotii TaxID=462710 RepID=A0ABP6BMQ5_9MICO